MLQIGSVESGRLGDFLLRGQNRLINALRWNNRAVGFAMPMLSAAFSLARRGGRLSLRAHRIRRGWFGGVKDARRTVRKAWWRDRPRRLIGCSMRFATQEPRHRAAHPPDLRHVHAPASGHISARSLRWPRRNGRATCSQPVSELHRMAFLLPGQTNCVAVSAHLGNAISAVSRVLARTCRTTVLRYSSRPKLRPAIARRGRASENTFRRDAAPGELANAADNEPRFPIGGGSASNHRGNAPPGEAHPRRTVFRRLHGRVLVERTRVDGQLP